MKTHLTVLAAALALLAVAGLPPAEAGPIKKRETRQQKRIAEGVESGQLTALETAKLEGGQAKIEADRHKALSDGVMTKKEKARLTREQNRASRRIYRQKHDAQVQPGTK
ncbi:MAG: hypothetical protein HY713_04745 [candidate division NC10 bacterium]|nr:hypothetical protein [candidate division NC10 bacterium]